MFIATSKGRNSNIKSNKKHLKSAKNISIQGVLKAQTRKQKVCFQFGFETINSLTCLNSAVTNAHSPHDLFYFETAKDRSLEVFLRFLL